MREYTPTKYKNLVEKTHDPILGQYMQAELDFISKIENLGEKTLIDLGAGYGRVIPFLAPKAKKIIAIEINPDMVAALREVGQSFSNTVVIDGDITHLKELLKKTTLQNPVLLLLQNTLGTIEGEWEKVIEEIRAVAETNAGGIVLSLFRQESLQSWGAKMYAGIKEMVGELDPNKTDYSQGEFISKTGYKSKWRSRQEIENIKTALGGQLIREIWTDHYWIGQISHTAG